MGLTISILVLLLSILRPSLIGGQPAGAEEFPAVLEKLAPSSVVRGPFAPPPSEVLSGDGTEVPEKSAKGLPSISETPTDTNRERQGGRGAGGGPRGFVERRAGKGEESGRESMSWREGSPMGSMSWREGRPMGSMSRERRTPSHCHLERGPVNATNAYTMIHIRPKSLPFCINVTMNVQNNSRSDSPIASYLARFSTELIKIWWRIGHWTAVHLEWRSESGRGWAHLLMGMKTKGYKPGYDLLPPIISIEPEKADWYIGDLNQACLEEEKAQTAEWNKCVKDKNECVNDKNECVNDKNECVKDKNECVNDKNECVKDKNECVNDKNECVKDKNECVNDKNVCVKIKNALFAERNKCVKDENVCVKDKNELFAEWNECVNDKNECVKDKNECVKDKNECVNDKNECVNDKNECVNDKNEYLAECQACLDEEKAQTEPTLFSIHGKFYNINIFINSIFYELIHSDK